MSKIRVLMVNGGLLHKGGTETFIMNTIRNLDPKIYEVDIMIHGDGIGEHDAELERLNINLLRVPIKGKHPIKNKQEIGNIISKGNYDVVHGNLNAQNGPLLKLAFKHKVPVRISHSHSTESYSTNPIKKLLGQFAMKLIPKYASDLLACSQKAGEWLYGTHDFIILKNPLDEKSFSYNVEKRNKIRRQFDLDSHFVYGHVGGFNHIKNHAFILELFKNINEINPSSKLLLVGDGSLKQEMENKANELGLKNAVKFTGNVDDVGAYMSAMDCFLFPSLFEGFGYVLLEAQCSGLKILSANTVDESVKITELIQFLPLEDKNLWLKESNKPIINLRRSHVEEIRLNGFDNESVISHLEKIYKN